MQAAVAKQRPQQCHSVPRRWNGLSTIHARAACYGVAESTFNACASRLSETFAAMGDRFRRQDDGDCTAEDAQRRHFARDDAVRGKKDGRR